MESTAHAEASGRASPIFAFTGRDALPQLVLMFTILFGGGAWPILHLLTRSGWSAGGAAGLFVIVVLVGLRKRIVVTPTEVAITQLWLIVPLWRWRAANIEDVFFGGDWGEPEGACGVVVVLEGKEIHLGSAQTMHHLYESLSPHCRSGDVGPR